VWKVADQVTLRTPPASGAATYPYRFGAVVRAFSNGQAFAGVRFVRKLGPGYLELEGGYGFPGPVIGAAFILPLR